MPSGQTGGSLRSSQRQKTADRSGHDGALCIGLILTYAGFRAPPIVTGGK
jgi:hypothetical protein